MSDLNKKYRPSSYKEVVGQKEAVEILRGLEKDLPTGILLAGDTGCGKTTLCRIFSSRILKCDARNIEQNPDYTEINIGANTGIDAAREFIENTKYASFGPAKVIALDEIHKQTPQAMSAMLKPLEDSPPNVLWIVITNEPGKLPKVSRDRLTEVKLKPVNEKRLIQLIRATLEKERIKLPEDIILSVAQNAQQTPRLALSILQAILARVKGKKEVTAKFLKTLAREVAAENVDPEIVALNLLYAFYINDIERFIKHLSFVTNDNSNAIARQMSYINDYQIYASMNVKRKLWSNHWQKINELAGVFKKTNSPKFLKRVALAQVDLVELAAQYPLIPMGLLSVFKD
jgi:DNA polymerase III gamma/tau subunit